MKLKPYPDLKLDLLTAYSLLDDHLTDAESWEVYAAIEFGRYDEALERMRELARESFATDAEEILAAIETQACEK